MHIVIIGATSTIAKHCARLWLQKQAVVLTLVGRDFIKLTRVANDLSSRNPKSEIHLIQAENQTAQDIQNTVDNIAAIGSFDIVLIAQGSLPIQTICQDDLSACSMALEVNAITPVLYAEAFAKYMELANRGSLVIIGSVASDRGRKSNYIYGAAKGLVSCYTQGLQHRFADTSIKVILIKPGPTDTPMTAHLKALGAKLAPADYVAKKIVNAVTHGKEVSYVPGKWQLIMFLIRNLPRFIFNKINI